MRHVLLSTFAMALLSGGLSLHAQSWQMPPDAQRCPTKWGAGDQRGAANWMKPDTILRATKLIKTGEMFELGMVLSPDPKETYQNEGRIYKIYTKPFRPVPNTRTSNEELIISEMGQIGTQFDAFPHQMFGESFYNCFKLSDIGTSYGFKKLGVENVGTLMTRGVLVDVAALKGVDMLPDTYAITIDDIQKALDKERLKIQPGDAVIINTGWGKLLGKDNDRYGKTSPGISLAAGEWLARQDPMLIAADNCCVEVIPSEPPMNRPVHGMMLIQYGIFLLENLKLDALAAAKAYEFAFMVQPLKFKGATGSTIAPVAIR
jgi:kynurenine formamidase